MLWVLRETAENEIDIGVLVIVLYTFLNFRQNGGYVLNCYKMFTQNTMDSSGNLSY